MTQDDPGPAASVEGKVVIVTGASRGIGRACVVALAEAGARVTAVARSEEQLECLADSLAGSDVRAVVADVGVPEDNERMVAETLDSFGRVDVAIANAGIETSARVAASDPQEWIATLTTNAVGSYLTARAVLPPMRDNGGGQILFVGSGVGHTPAFGLSAYGASKAAVSHLSATLAQEVWRWGIDVNELVPGPVATDMTQGRFEVGQPPEHLPSERVKAPEAVASFVVDLLRLGPGGPTGQVFSLARRPL